MGYMTTDISPEGLLAVYEALNWTPSGKVTVKLSTGKPPTSNYLRPELIAGVVHEVDGTIVKCNTACGGSRRTENYVGALDGQIVYVNVMNRLSVDCDGNPAEPGGVLQ